ncbi:MAG: DNA double-strand break repair nuclease NurA [Marinisporobacter sp.]|jgi:hypothetical protein|nr:DNA double-strand break repair nuclease NurA [Marinisporobacter sp.]
MSFNSMRNRKPFERASMVNHSQLIQNKHVQAFINECIIPESDLDKIEYPVGHAVNLDEIDKIKHIISIDGGYSETYINKGFPSTAIAFFNLGVLLFEREALENIERSVIINPEDLKKLKEIDKIPLAIPARNVLMKGCQDFSHGVRKVIYQFFNSKASSAFPDKTLIEALRWLMFRGWSDGEKVVPLDFCPYEDCKSKKTEFYRHGPNVVTCKSCGREIYLTDYFRFHEIINEPNGASGIFGYLTSLIEQILLVQIIKYFYENNKQCLSKMLFIKDGPLAFFGQTFRLHKPMRELIAQLFKAGENKESIINIVGLEKSGPFVEHAFYIQEKLKENHFYILNDEYIRKYIVSQTSQNVYGHNTYYGWKVIYKTEEKDVLVISIPVEKYIGDPKPENFSNIEAVLSVLSKMRCNMYENSVVPIALINKLVSISEFPSSKILENYIKKNID